LGARRRRAIRGHAGRSGIEHAARPANERRSSTYDGASVTQRPRPERYKTGAEYRWAHKLWKRQHGGSMIGNVAVAVLAGGLTGSRIAVVLFVLLAVGVTLARRRA
jgi:hypothetical protein